MTLARRQTHWGLLLLLLSGVTINYIDRGSLSVAAPMISREFALNDWQLGLLFSAFFWSYSLCQFAAGWAVDRYDAKWIYGAGFVMWSVATALTAFVTQFTALLWLRLLLGIAESVNYPAVSNLVARHVPDDERGFANGLVDAGSKIGPALSTLIGGLLVASLGWRALFLGVGIGSLIWLWPWIVFAPSVARSKKCVTTGPDLPGADASATIRASSPPTAASPALSQMGPTMLDIFSRRELWGTSCGMFALGYVWYFLLSWLPSYLVKQREFSLNSMALLGSIPFWGMACTSIAGGWVSDRWIRSGASPTFVRKLFVIFGLASCALFMFPAGFVKNASLCLWLLVIASFSLGIFTSNVWAMTQTLAGPSAAGKWAGIQNAIGNFGGIVSPALTGWIATKTGSFFWAFAAASVVLLFGIASYVTLVGKVAPLDWGKPVSR